MSNVVVDASVLIAVITNEPDRDRLIELTLGTTLIAPHSVHWEIGNAFSAMLKRDRITLSQAQNALAAYEQIPIRYVDIEIDRALDIADLFKIYAYDAYLIRCAQKYQTTLLTLDRRLMATAQEAGIRVVEI
ncbi:MAG: type II toxin-antitoxin system VapC family toxin [Anaerolineales bacterium]|nr:type II toxin-antitoxin system VapC family toxin [Anaerolineales bacterium]MCB0015443.1 type II toxin-antitoxin system VapC family toxin [Anaerolineales bacterium]MCB8960162.1 type II toxin-antitoxin system VapC family toxin [Ardenticatenales bacterium]